MSIGHELLINPSVLLLDEPTSGLDSTTAMHVLDILRQLATGGRAVVTTIHQPSSRLYQTLDKLMLLSQVASFPRSSKFPAGLHEKLTAGLHVLQPIVGSLLISCFLAKRFGSGDVGFHALMRQVC